MTELERVHFVMKGGVAYKRWERPPSDFKRHLHGTRAGAIT